MPRVTISRPLFRTVLVLAVTGATPALAATWTGTGEMYDRDRNLIGPYDLEVKTSVTSPSEETIDVKVTAGGTVVHTDHCVMSKDDNRWSKTCTNGSGAGYYFNFGLAQEYYEGRDGSAFATQIIFDSDVSMRLLRTELRNGEAVRFFVESLARAAE